MKKCKRVWPKKRIFTKENRHFLQWERFDDFSQQFLRISSRKTLPRGSFLHPRQASKCAIFLKVPLMQLVDQMTITEGCSTLEPGFVALEVEATTPLTRGPS